MKERRTNVGVPYAGSRLGLQGQFVKRSKGWVRKDRWIWVASVSSALPLRAVENIILVKGESR